MAPLRILILGGTTEATELAQRLEQDSRFAPTFSLAGVTQSPLRPAIPVRIGGFGGIDGLVRYIEQQHIHLIVVATHPFAAQMRAHAIEAAKRARCAVLIVQRPPWQALPEDQWIHVPDMTRAAAALGSQSRRVWLTVGRKELAAFQAHPQHHYVIRTIDAPPAESLPPDVELITARGPFNASDEEDLLISRRIDVLVTKNAGGTATQAKLIAARRRGVPVVMIDRPAMPHLMGTAAHSVETVAETLWHLEQAHQDFLATVRRV